MRPSPTQACAAEHIGQCSARRVDGRARALVRRQVGRRPAGDLELGMPRRVARARLAVAVGEPLDARGVDEHRAERTVAGIGGFARELDGTAEVDRGRRRRSPWFESAPRSTERDDAPRASRRRAADRRTRGARGASCRRDPSARRSTRPRQTRSSSSRSSTRTEAGLSASTRAVTGVSGRAARAASSDPAPPRRRSRGPRPRARGDSRGSMRRTAASPRPRSRGTSRARGRRRARAATTAQCPNPYVRAALHRAFDGLRRLAAARCAAARQVLPRARVAVDAEVVVDVVEGERR